MVAIDCDGYLCRVYTIKPRGCGRKPLGRAVSKVERAGENMAAWEDATRAAVVADLMVIRQVGIL
jgi:hypothetical protein